MPRIRSTGKNTLLVKRTIAQYFNVTDLEQYQGVAWRLQDIPSYGEYTALFDQYKICMVKQKWVFTNAPQAEGTFTTASMSTFHYAIDNNDATPASSLSNLEEYQRYKNRIIAAEKPFTIAVKPTWLGMAYDGALGAGYTSKRGWIATSDPGVYHYGIKWAIIPGLGGVAGTVFGRLYCYTTYYIALKQTK